MEHTTHAWTGWTALAIGFLSAACGGEGCDPADPVCSGQAEAQLLLVAGNDQLGRPGQTLAEPLMVQLGSPSGDPVAKPGVTVTWTTTSPDGSFDESTTVTDAAGRASVLYTLGSDEGVHDITAEAEGLISARLLARSIERPRPIAYARGERWSFDWDIYLMEPDGSDRVQLTGSIRKERSPSWSRDGTQLAYLQDGVCNADIVILDVQTLTERRITPVAGCATVDALSWSPDGSRFALIVDESGDDEVIRVINADGSGLRVLAEGSGPSWSPVDDLVAYRYRSPDRAINDIFLIPAKGGPATRITDDRFGGRPGGWSPDGRRLAASKKTPPQSGCANFSLWLMDPDGSNRTMVPGSDEPDGHCGGAGGGSWSPSGDSIVTTFIRSAPATARCAPDSTTDIVIFDLVNGTSEVIANDLCMSHQASWRGEKAP